MREPSQLNSSAEIQKKKASNNKKHIIDTCGREEEMEGGKRRGGRSRAMLHPGCGLSVPGTYVFDQALKHNVKHTKTRFLRQRPSRTKSRQTTTLQILKMCDRQNKSCITDPSLPLPPMSIQVLGQTKLATNADPAPTVPQQTVAPRQSSTTCRNGPKAPPAKQQMTRRTLWTTFSSSGVPTPALLETACRKAPLWLQREPTA